MLDSDLRFTPPWAIMARPDGQRREGFFTGQIEVFTNGDL
jgi:hypothetical protein